jgi:hypothetical protein
MLLYTPIEGAELIISDRLLGTRACRIAELNRKGIFSVIPLDQLIESGLNLSQITS